MTCVYWQIKSTETKTCPSIALVAIVFVWFSKQRIIDSRSVYILFPHTHLQFNGQPFAEHNNPDKDIILSAFLDLVSAY